MATTRVEKPFTHKSLEAATVPGLKIVDPKTELEGGGRLVLLVRSPTRKSWVLRRRSGGRDSTTKVGEFPAMSIAEARKVARDISSGQRPDPAVQGGTLRALLEAYIAHLGDRPSARDARWAAAWLLGREWTHPLARKRARLVEPHELADLLRAKAQAGATVSVNRARAMLHAAYAFGAKLDLDFTRPAGVPRFAINANPVTNIPRKEAFEKERKVEIEHAVLHDIWRELEALGPFGTFGRLAILTLQRLKQLEKAQIEGDTLLIRDTKGRGAREKLNRLPITPSMASALRDGALDMPGGYAALSSVLRPRKLRATDIRRTGETYLGEQGVSEEERGHLLSHGRGRSPLVRRHYDMAERLDRKRELLMMWEAYAVKSASG